MDISKNLTILAKKCLCFKKIFYFEKLDSTNTYILNLKDYHKDEPIALVAYEQTSGKGRLSNSWISPKGNIYLSLLLPLSYMPKNLSLLSMAPAVAIINAFKKLKVESFIKWPNDILIKSIDNKSLKYFLNYRKVGGILVQTHNKNNKIDHAVIGVGINIEKNIDIQNSIYHAGFLKEIINCDYEIILSEVITELDKICADFNEKDIYDNYIKNCVTINNLVTFSFDNKKCVGKAVGVKTTGALLVEFENNIVTVNADEVHFC